MLDVISCADSLTASPAAAVGKVGMCAGSVAPMAAK